MALTHPLRGPLLMTAAMTCFVVNDAFMKSVAADLPLYQSIALRGLLTCLALIPLAARSGALRPRLSPRDRRILALRSLAEVLGTVTFLTALTKMPFANLSAIMQFLPLAVTLAAAVTLGEPIGPRRIGAILAGLAGVLIIIRPGTAGFDIWSLLALASVAAVVLRDLSTRALSAAAPSVTVVVWAAVSVTSVALALSGIEGWEPVGPAAAAQIAGAAAFILAGYILVVLATRSGDIGLVAPFRYTALVVAILAGWLVFGEIPDVWMLAGSALVVASGLYALYREGRAGALRHAAPASGTGTS